MSASGDMNTTQQGRHTNQPTEPEEQQLQIEELFEDEIGLDGEIDVIKPTEYEDVESPRDESEPASIDSLADANEEAITARMSNLHCEPRHEQDHSMTRGRKRLSREMSNIDSRPLDAEELEVTEVPSEDDNHQDKRRKARLGTRYMVKPVWRRLKSPSQTVHSPGQTGSEPSTPKLPASPAENNVELMDLG